MGWMRWEPDAEQLNGGAGYDTDQLDTDQWGDLEWQEYRIITEWEDSDEWGSGSDQDTADAPKTADAAPEPPRTPEQPTAAVSRATPTKDAARELLDTRIVPRALWGVAGEGLQQEQALWVVAAHDATALADALCGALGGQCMAAALLNWGRQTGKHPDSQQSTQQADRDTHAAVHPLSPLPTHAVLMKRYLGLLAPPVETAAATTQPQQAQLTSTSHTPAIAARTTEDNDQHQQQQPTARQRRLREYNAKKASEMQRQQQSDLQCHRRCKTEAQGTYTSAHEPAVASIPAITLTHEEWQRAQELQLLSFLDEAEEVAQAWEATGFLTGARKPLWQDHPLDRLHEIWAMIEEKEKEYKTTNTRMIRRILQKKHDCEATLKPNSPRAGDDWAD